MNAPQQQRNASWLRATNGSAHDASTRLLDRCRADGNAWWAEGPHGVSLTTGWLMINDTTRDKPSRRAIALGHRHWLGTPHRVVVGNNLISTRWIDGEAHLPGDVRIADTAHDGVTTSKHVQMLVTAAAARGCQPHLLGCDRWSARVEHVKLVHSLHCQWLPRLPAHRVVDPAGAGNRPIRGVRIPRHSAIVHLTGYGFSGMRVAQGAKDARYLWRIAASQRGITQCCGSERA